MVMSYECSNRRKILFDHLNISFNVVLMCKIVIKYQFASRAMCAYAQMLQKRTECALIGACANTVFYLIIKNKSIVICSLNKQEHE